MSKRKTAGIVTIGLVIAGIVAIVGIGIARTNAQTTHFGGADTHGTEQALLDSHGVSTPAASTYQGTKRGPTDDCGQPAVYGRKGLDTGSGEGTGFYTPGGTFLGSRGGVDNQGVNTVGVSFSSGGRGMHFGGGDSGADFGEGGFFAGTREVGFGQDAGRGGFGTAHHTGAGGFGA